MSDNTDGPTGEEDVGEIMRNAPPLKVPLKVSYPEFCLDCGANWPIGWGLPLCYSCLTEEDLRDFLKELDLQDEEAIKEAGRTGSIDMNTFLMPNTVYVGGKLIVKKKEKEP